jgi:hypothetical protein
MNYTKDQLEQLGITKYRITDGNKITVFQDVDWSKQGLTKIPIKLEKVCGSMNLNDNELEDLENSPRIVTGAFAVVRNKLTTLKGAPENVGSFYISGNPMLKSIEYAPICKMIKHEETGIDPDDIELYKYIKNYFIWQQDISLNENIKDLLLYAPQSNPVVRSLSAVKKFEEIRGIRLGLDNGIL